MYAYSLTMTNNPITEPISNQNSSYFATSVPITEPI